MTTELALLSRLGRREEPLEALTDLARERPRDEEALLELLRCEAATTGPSAALARYDAYRRSLRDELGTDPGPALQAEHQRLLQGELPAVRHGVPHEPNPLLGRDGDIAAVADLLRTSRVTSIVGAGGLGKTRLAYVVSRQAEQRAVHLVALAGVTSDDDVVNEVASALGVGESRRTSVGSVAIPMDVLTGIVNAFGPGPVLRVVRRPRQRRGRARRQVGIRRRRVLVCRPESRRSTSRPGGSAGACSGLTTDYRAGRAHARAAALRCQSMRS